MKATGIVRRIDDLGRIVIPKEIRKTMHIREGAQLEIFIDNEGSVIFRKYSPIGELEHFVKDYVETLAKVTGNTVVIVDKDVVIAAHGNTKKELLQQKISQETVKLIEARKQYVYRIGDHRALLCPSVEQMYAGVVNPLIVDGDTIGALIMMIPELGNAPSEADVKVLAASAQILCRQLNP